MISPRWKTWPDGWKNLRIDISRTTILPANFDGCGGKTVGETSNISMGSMFFTERERERESSISFRSQEILCTSCGIAASLEGLELLLSCL